MISNGLVHSRTASPDNLPSDEIIFGRSHAMRLVRQTATKVCRTNVPILIQGSGGTGKELLARWIHAHSPFTAGEFVKVNCAAIPGTLLESELFGYEKGAFTGAYASKPGRVEFAHKGTLFLDGIGDLDLGLQAKLLQFLQDGRFTRIGDQAEHAVETRVICSTIRTLPEEIERGRFRPDLYYRINVIGIHVPPLSERREDIELLADYLRVQFNARFEKSAPPFSPGILHRLTSWEWPGNIRELENRIARYVLLGEEDLIARARQETRSKAGAAGTIPLRLIAKQAIRELEHDLILRVLEEKHWNRREAADALRISYRALLYKIRASGLSPRPKSRKAQPDLNTVPASGTAIQ